jgi:hypothetical protein
MTFPAPQDALERLAAHHEGPLCRGCIEAEMAVRDALGDASDRTLLDGLRAAVSGLHDGCGTIIRLPDGRAVDPAVLMRNAVLRLIDEREAAAKR